MIPTPEVRDFGTPDRKHVQLWWEFPNWWAVSAVQGDHLYSEEGEPGTFEVAVLHRHRDGGACLDYTTPITTDVLGWQTIEQIEEIVETVMGFEPYAHPEVVFETCPASRPAMLAELKATLDDIPGLLDRVTGMKDASPHE